MSKSAKPHHRIRVTVVAIVAGLVAAVGLLLIAVGVLEDDATVDTAAASPFYVAPNPLPSGPPGKLLRSEPAAVPDSLGAPAGTRARRVLYLSKSPHGGQSIAVSGVVYLPPGSAPAVGRPVLAWAHGTKGVSSSCAPSLNANPPASTLPGLGTFLRRGWVVTASDYQGLGTAGPTAYLDGLTEGRAVLDSIRAAQQVTGSDAGDKTIIWGHSQGGHAAFFAGDIAPKYAPELKVLGVAAAAPALELGKLAAMDANGVVGSILGSYLLWSWPRTQPGIKLGGIVKPGAQKLINAIASRCLVGVKNLVEEAAVGEALELSDLISIPKLLGDRDWARVLAQDTPREASSGPPLFVAQGTADTVIDPQTTYDFVSRLCAKGREVSGLRMAGIDHLHAGIAAAPALVTWATERLAGKPVANDCVTPRNPPGPGR